MIFLVSPDSIAPNAYTLTELLLAKRKWRNLSRRVLPVWVRDTGDLKLPPEIASLVPLKAVGNLEAEVVARVAELAARQKAAARGGDRPRWILRAGIASAAVAAAAAFLWWRAQPVPTPVETNVSEPGGSEPGGDVLTGTPASDPPECDELGALARCAEGWAKLARLICADQQATAAMLNDAANGSAQNPGAERDKVYLWGAVNSDDPRDKAQLDTLFTNMTGRFANEPRPADPPKIGSRSEIAPLLEGGLPGAFQRERDALMIVSSQINAAQASGTNRSGDSTVFYSEGRPPMTLGFTLPENAFELPLAVHWAAYKYASAQNARTLREKMDDLDEARQTITFACRAAP
jgi:hypothetical protein